MRVPELVMLEIQRGVFPIGGRVDRFQVPRHLRLWCSPRRHGVEFRRGNGNRIVICVVGRGLDVQYNACAYHRV
jgi:hypothetical protein